MRKGDLCWIRNRATGGFCIGRIAGHWEYRSSPEYIEADIVNVRPCAWFHSDVCPKGGPWLFDNISFLSDALGIELKAIATEAAGSELTRLRQRFWNRYLQKHPGVFSPSGDSNVWIPMLPDGTVVLSMYVGSKTSGMFLRGRKGADSEHLAPFMSRYADTLEQALGPNQSTTGGYHYGTSRDIALQQDSRWDQLIDWMETQRQRYAMVLGDIEAQDAAGTP